jgi:hypothetical protein
VTSYVPFLAFDHGPYRKISASAYLCALSMTGRVECYDSRDQDAERDGVIDISAGVASMCLLMQDHRVLCKGDNGDAELGNGTVGAGSVDLVEVHLPTLY